MIGKFWLLTGEWRSEWGGVSWYWRGMESLWRGISGLLLNAENGSSF